jgi:hypothetical protein
MKEKDKTLTKMLENPAVGLRTAKGVYENESLRGVVPDGLPENTILRMQNGNVIEPLPHKFSQKVVASSNLTKVKGPPRSFSARFGQHVIGKRNAANPRGIVDFEEEQRRVPDPTSGDEVRMDAGTYHDNELEQMMEQVKLQNGLMTITDRPQGQPSAKISAVPGESGSSQVFTTPRPIPDPTDKSTSPRLTISKLRKRWQ